MKISPQHIADLVQAEQEKCVSIYLPSPESRLKKGYGERFPEFTHQVKIARELLAKSGMTKAEISSFLQPIEKFQSDERLYSRKHKGMVFFCRENFCSFFQLPIEVKPCTYVSSHLFILPLLPLMDNSFPESYFLLRLATDKASLYKGTHESLSEVDTTGIFPHSLREVVGEDFKESPLQKRSLPTGSRQAIYHGRGKDDRKPEIGKFYREIDKGLKRFFMGNSNPLIVDALPHLFSIYVSISHLPNLISAPLSPALNGISQKDIPNRVVQHLKAYWKELGREKSRISKEDFPTHLLCENLEEMDRASKEGRIDRLFIPSVQRRWEGIDETSLNLMAIQTLKNGGKVKTGVESDPPLSTSTIWAVFRY